MDHLLKGEDANLSNMSSSVGIGVSCIIQKYFQHLLQLLLDRK